MNKVICPKCLKEIEPKEFGKYQGEMKYKCPECRRVFTLLENRTKDIPAKIYV